MPKMDGKEQKSGFYNNNIKASTNNGFIATDIPPKDGVVLKIDDSLFDELNENTQGSSKETEDVPIVEQNEAVGYTLRSTVIGCLLGLLAALMLAVGQGCIQLLDGSVGDFQLVVMRTFFQGWLGASFYIRKRKLPRVDRDKWIWLFLLCVCAVSVNLLFGIGVRYIPAGVSACLRRCTDVIAVTIFSALILRELLTPVKAVCVGVCLGGVVMLIQPWHEEPQVNGQNSAVTTLPENLSVSVQYSDHPNHTYTVSDLNRTESPPPLPPDEGGLSAEIMGYILVSVAGVLSAMVTLLQKYKLMKVNAWTLNLYIGLLGATVTGTISLATEDITFPTDVDNIVYITIQSLIWGFAALTRLKAVSIAPALLVTMVMAMQIVFLLIGQYTVLSHVQPGIGNWVEITGAVLVVISIVTPPGWEIMRTKLNPTNMSPESTHSDTANAAIETEPETFDIRL